MTVIQGGMWVETERNGETGRYAVKRVTVQESAGEYEGKQTVLLLNPDGDVFTADPADCVIVNVPTGR